MEVSEDRTDCSKDTTSGSFYIRSHSPRGADKSFYASTPRGDSDSQAKRLSERAPPSPLNAKKDVNGTKDSINGLERPVAKPRTQLNSDSSYSIDVLSGGESEGDTLRRRKDDTLGRLLKSSVTNGVMINSEYVNMGTGTLDSVRGGGGGRRGGGTQDRAFYIAKEILMTERTYKKDLEVISVWLREKIPVELEHEMCGGPVWAPLDCMLSVQGPALRALEARLGARPGSDAANGNNGDGSHTTTGAIVLDYLTECLPFYDKWISEHGDSIRRLESACVSSPTLERTCREVELHQRACYLPINVFLLKPLYRLLHLRKILEFGVSECDQDDDDLEDLSKCLDLLKPSCEAIQQVLPDSLNYSYLCLLQRDIEGVENLVQSDRNFLRQGCLYKHTSRGPQQRMFFLFSDVLIYGSKSYSSQQQFRVHGIIPLNTVSVELSEYTNSLSLYGSGRAMTLSASTAADRDSWLQDIRDAAHAQADASSSPNNTFSRSMSTSSSAEELAEGVDTMSGSVQRINTLAHVCWHRNTSLSWGHLYHGMENQLSGYLLRKFKNSSGWQKLWVVFASFCLYFYKTCYDDHPLASLPLLGYLITTPSERDSISKDYVFKLVFKNHIYFFRAESEYTFSRWLQVIGSATTQQASSNINNNL